MGRITLLLCMCARLDWHFMAGQAPAVEPARGSSSVPQAFNVTVSDSPTWTTICLMHPLRSRPPALRHKEQDKESQVWNDWWRRWPA